MWIQIIQIRYNVSKWSIRQVKYVIHKNDVEQLKLKCKDHNLGLELYKHVQLQQFYSDVSLKYLNMYLSARFNE